MRAYTHHSEPCHIPIDGLDDFFGRSAAIVARALLKFAHRTQRYRFVRRRRAVLALLGENGLRGPVQARQEPLSRALEQLDAELAGDS